MEKVIGFVKKYKLYLIGGVFGALGGYLYWQNVGCQSGTCPITSSPVMSTIWGALIGGSGFSMFKKKDSGEEQIDSKMDGIDSNKK